MAQTRVKGHLRKVPGSRKQVRVKGHLRKKQMAYGDVRDNPIEDIIVSEGLKRRKKKNNKNRRIYYKERW